MQFSDLDSILKSYPIHNILPVPTSNQSGPNCGFYALHNVMQYYANQFGCKSLPARYRDCHLPGEKKPSSNGFNSLRQIGKHVLATSIGEIWEAQKMVTIARMVGYNAEVIPADLGDFVSKIVSAIDDGYPVIVAIDVSSDSAATNGQPGAFGGEHAHWIAIVGYGQTNTGEVYFGHTHWGNYFISAASGIRDSNFQLSIFSKNALQIWAKSPKKHAYDKISADVADQYKKIATFQDIDLSGLRCKIIVFKNQTTAPVLIQGAINKYLSRFSGFSGFFTHQSSQSKNAVEKLGQAIKMNDINRLKQLMLWYMGKTKNKPHDAGEILKTDSTLYRTLSEAFTGKFLV